MSRTKTYRAWWSMRARCKDLSNPNYGGRGIKVDPRWESFTNFLEDMGVAPEGLTLDRIDNDGDYEPGNCRWATHKEQSRNQRTSVCIEIDGKVKTLAEWSELSGVRRETLWRRYHTGEKGARLIRPTPKMKARSRLKSSKQLK